MMTKSKKTIWVKLTITDPMTANIYKSLLESSNIPVFLRSDATNTVHPFTIGVLGDVEILVPPKELHIAEELINNFQIDLDKEEDKDDQSD